MFKRKKIVILFISLVLLNYLFISYTSAQTTNERINTLIGSLKDENFKHKCDAVEELVKIGAPATKALIGVLDDEKADVFAVIAIIKIGEPAIESLIETLKDEKPPFLVDRAFKLIGKQAVKHLIVAIQDENPNLRTNIISILAGINDKQAVEPLITALKDKNDIVRESAASALGVIKDNRAVEPLIDALADKDEDVRLNVASSLGKIKDNRAVEPLIRALKDEDKFVRSYVADALGVLKDNRAVEPLIAALKDKDDIVLYSVGKALGRIKDSRAIEPLITALNDDYMKDKAAWSLGEIKDDRATKHLIKTLTNEDEYVRFVSAEALGKLKNSIAVEPLKYTLNDTDPFVRLQSALALWRMTKNSQYIEPLMDEIKNDKKLIGVLEVDAFAEIKNSRFTELLITVLKDEDINFNIKAKAIEALEKINDRRALKPLSDALKNKNPFVQIKAAKSLWHINKDSRALDILISSLKDDLMHARSEAVQVLGEIKNSQAIEPLIDVIKNEYDALCRNAEELRYITLHEDYVINVRKQAGEALKKITGQDFGEDYEAWSKWWQENKDKFQQSKKKM